MLLTNGCSFVWGDELEGFLRDPPDHHKHTFTHKLAKLLDVPYENLARCGNGNDKIFRDTIVRLNDTSLPVPTHMVILWSSWQRMETANPSDRHQYAKGHIDVEDCMIQFSEERSVYTDEKTWGAITKYYNEFYDVRTSIIQQLSYMLSIQKLCESMNVKLIQGAFHPRLVTNIALALNDKSTEWNEYNEKISKMISFLTPTSRLGLGQWTDMATLAKTTEGLYLKPENHPCEGTHHEYAKLLHHIFTNYY